MKTHIKAFLLSAILVLPLVSCHKEKKEETPAIPKIEVATPEIDSVTLHKTYPGSLYAVDKIAVVARVNGIITSRPYSKGTRVPKGAVLYTIEDTKYRDAVAQAKAALATAESQLDYATRRYAAMQKALQSDAVSQMDVTQAQATMQQAKASVDNARASLSIAQTNLGYCVVRAPISGYTSSSSVDVGEYVGGEGSPVQLLHIYNDDSMTASFSVEQSQYQEIVAATGGLKGDLYRRVPIESKSPLSRAYTADMTYASPNVSSSTGTVTIEGSVQNPDHELRDGMYITINLPYGTDPRALLIRDASIGTDQLGRYVYVVNDSNKVVYTPIKVGEVVRDSLRIVTEGLKPGDRYVTKALLTVRNGMTVDPVSKAK